MRRELYQLLKSLCFNCNRLRIPKEQREAYLKKLQYLLAGDLLRASTCDEAIARGGARASSKGDSELVDDVLDLDVDTEPAFEVGDSGFHGGPLTSNVLLELQVRAINTDQRYHPRTILR